MWLLALMLAPIIAAWDVWTRGSIAVAVISTAAAILFAAELFAHWKRKGRVTHLSDRPTARDSPRSFSPMVILTGQAPALQFARAFAVGTVLFRYGFAPNEPLFVDAILAAMVSGVCVLMSALLMPTPSDKG
jgi:hypothetical protein